MEQLLNTHVRSIILTSGTLAPLPPLIAELAIPVAQHLENPHIVKQSQVYVKIIGSGPDREQLISNYANRYVQCVLKYIKNSKEFLGTTFQKFLFNYLILQTT